VPALRIRSYEARQVLPDVQRLEHADMGEHRSARHRRGSAGRGHRGGRSHHRRGAASRFPPSVAPAFFVHVDAEALGQIGGAVSAITLRTGLTRCAAAAGMLAVQGRFGWASQTQRQLAQRSQNCMRLLRRTVRHRPPGVSARIESSQCQNLPPSTTATPKAASISVGSHKVSYGKFPQVLLLEGAGMNINITRSPRSAGRPPAENPAVIGGLVFLLGQLRLRPPVRNSAQLTFDNRRQATRR
jgi:hypothetical protein